MMDLKYLTLVILKVKLMDIAKLQNILNKKLKLSIFQCNLVIFLKLIQTQSLYMIIVDIKVQQELMRV